MVESRRPDDWRASLQADAAELNVRQVLADAKSNIEFFIEWFSGEFSPSDEGYTREVGGLDKSAADISQLLGIEYIRRYENDGCVLGEHDGGEGCEEGEGGEAYDEEENEE